MDIGIDAKLVFKKGDKVFISVDGLRQQVLDLEKYSGKGVVAGFSREGQHLIRVSMNFANSRVTVKRPQAFAWWFWERA